MPLCRSWCKYRMEDLHKGKCWWDTKKHIFCPRPEKRKRIQRINKEEIRCECGSKSFRLGPKGGMGRNIKCFDCGKKYLVSPFGMEVIRMECPCISCPSETKEKCDYYLEANMVGRPCAEMLRYILNFGNETSRRSWEGGSEIKK